MAATRDYRPLHSVHGKKLVPDYSVTSCLIPFLFVTTFIAAIFVIMGDAPLSESYHLKYSTVPGYFLQDDPATDPHGFDYTTTNFGLISRSYDTDAEFDPDSKKTQWQRFEQQVSKLNDESGPDVEYKVFYCFHNVAEAFYGTKAWDCYWSLQTGNGTSSWVDAELTSIGIAQAQKANTHWRAMISDQKIPAPQSYYASPHMRCLSTAEVTFSGLDLPKDRPFKPIIKEMFRECIGVHTCDMRSSKTKIRERVPEWIIEDGFAEVDELWSPILRESDEAQDQRAKVAFDDVFTHDPNTWISVSSHSGQIASALRVLGHRVFGLGTGQVIPVLIKAEKIPGTLPPVKPAPWFTPETCSEPPPMKTS